MAFSRVMPMDELWDGDMLACEAAGQRLVLVRLGDEVHAYEDRCAHLGMPMSAGRFIDGQLICSAHLYQYDARTGRGINPRNVCLRKFPVKLEADAIFVDLESS